MDLSPTSCCGRPLEVIQLAGTADASADPVEMLRCRTCSRSSWRRGDRLVQRGEALGALAQAHTRPTQQRAVARTPRPQPAVRPAAVARNSATSAPRDLSDLLPGWSVLGA